MNNNVLLSYDEIDPELTRSLDPAQGSMSLYEQHRRILMGRQGHERVPGEEGEEGAEHGEGAVVDHEGEGDAAAEHEQDPEPGHEHEQDPHADAAEQDPEAESRMHHAEEYLRQAVVSSLAQAAGAGHGQDGEHGDAEAGAHGHADADGDVSMEDSARRLDEDGAHADDAADASGAGDERDAYDPAAHAADQGLADDGLSAPGAKKRARRSSAGGGGASGSGTATGTGTGRRGRPPLDTDEDPVERKIRQREANRKAAEKSRGKKRGEIHALEETVRSIQDENARLRTQLESLLAIAQTNGTGPSAGGPGQGAPASPPAGGSADTTLDAALPLALPSDAQLDALPTAGIDTAYAPGAGAGGPPDILGELGLDLPRLAALHRQITLLRAQVAAYETQAHTHAAAAAAASGAHPADGATTSKAVNKQIRTERTSLVAQIAQLKEEREAIERENALLEREVRRRKLVGAVDGVGAGSAAGGVGAAGAGASPTTAPAVSTATANGAAAPATTEEVAPAPADGSNIGVERALMEVRSWLDDALKGWSESGMLRKPASVALPLPAAPHSPPTAQPLASTSHAQVPPSAPAHQEEFSDFAFVPSAELTPEQVTAFTQYVDTANASAGVNGGGSGSGRGQAQGQGMNLLSEASSRV